MHVVNQHTLINPTQGSMLKTPSRLCKRWCRRTMGLMGQCQTCTMWRLMYRYVGGNFRVVLCYEFGVHHTTPCHSSSQQWARHQHTQDVKYSQRCCVLSRPRSRLSLQCRCVCTVPGNSTSTSDMLTLLVPTLAACFHLLSCPRTRRKLLMAS